MYKTKNIASKQYSRISQNSAHKIMNHTCFFTSSFNGIRTVVSVNNQHLSSFSTIGVAF